MIDNYEVGTLFSISFIFALLFIISTFLLALPLICYSFGFLRWDLRLLMWEFSLFLMYIFRALAAPHSLALATMSHKFLYIVFSFISMFFFFSWNFFFELFRHILFGFQVFEDVAVIFLLMISSLILLCLFQFI